MNTLVVPFIRSVRVNGRHDLATLPGTLLALSRDEISSFTALRPHQRHAWHAFLAQLVALALLQAGRTELPMDEDGWRDLLRGLTPGDPDDAPWRLVSSPDRPALLQPPVGELAGLRNIARTPDSLDMLVTSKAHDLKPAVMTQAMADDWLFALLTLQTTEGFLGAGNYGISRMNGGFANRPALGLAPPGGPGAHLARDVRRLLAMGGRPPGSQDYALDGGLALVWLRSWDGTASLPRSVLHPLYIEVCRRVRLVADGAGLMARVGNSKVPRIVPTPGGVTGDPWTPVRGDKDGAKALTVDSRGFGYRPLVSILFPRDGSRAPLQEVVADDAAEDLALVARALVRGQGKTEGYHERRVPLSRIVRRFSGALATDPVADVAHTRVRLAGEMARVLRFALLALFENGPDKVDSDNDAAVRKATPFIVRFEREVDADFFDALWREVEEDDPASRHTERARWIRSLLHRARALLAEADGAGAKSTRRRFRARVQAEAALHGAARRNKDLADYLQPETVPDAA